MCVYIERDLLFSGVHTLRHLRFVRPYIERHFLFSGVRTLRCDLFVQRSVNIYVLTGYVDHSLSMYPYTSFDVECTPSLQVYVHYLFVCSKMTERVSSTQKCLVRIQILLRCTYSPSAREPTHRQGVAGYSSTSNQSISSSPPSPPQKTPRRYTLVSCTCT